jgi:hypothetical protein
MLVSDLIRFLQAQPQDNEVVLRTRGLRPELGDQDGYVPVEALHVEPAYCDDNGLWKANDDDIEKGLTMNVTVID